MNYSLQWSLTFNRYFFLFLKENGLYINTYTHSNFKNCNSVEDLSAETFIVRHWHTEYQSLQEYFLIFSAFRNFFELHSHKSKQIHFLESYFSSLDQFFCNIFFVFSVHFTSLGRVFQCLYNVTILLSGLIRWTLSHRQPPFWLD